VPIYRYVFFSEKLIHICCKCSMSRHRKWAHIEVVPAGITVFACVGSKADAAAGACVP
jgi:hypothetical protein